MQITINNKPNTTAAKTLQQLANELTLPEKGVAVAVENQMIPRDQWNNYSLQEGAHVVSITAACGG